MTQINEKSIYKIGQVAKQLNISVELIRAYEHEGIFLPQKTKSGQRIFTDEDIKWLNCIRRLLTEQGLNIEGIRRMLALIPCWNLKPCSEKDRENCPAYSDSIKPCWTMQKDLPEICRTENCRECNVYKNAIKCENLKSLLYSFKTA